MGIVSQLLGPLGLKGAPEPKNPRKPVRKVSTKKAAYLASPAREKGKRHMAAVAMLPCLICGARPVEVHHDTGAGSDPAKKPRSDMRVLPLCSFHHRREFGPGAYHYNPRAFYARHGSSEELLKRVDDMLRAADDDALGEWF